MGSKMASTVLSARPRVVGQRHHRATIQTNLALYIHRTQLVIQFCQIALYLFGAHPSMVIWIVNPQAFQKRGVIQRGIGGD